jgi:hypothetical protein
MASTAAAKGRASAALGGMLKIIAAIKEATVIERILTHLNYLPND